MCFSAPVSFGAAALLVPLGLRALWLAWQTNRRFLGLAAFPLLFGLQQMSEGLLWLNLAGFHAEYTRNAALGFLFFVYLAWPMMTPLAARALEDHPVRRSILLYTALFAGLMGALVFFPLLPGDARLHVSIVQHSIFYEHRPLFDLPWDDWLSRGGFALVITLPLLTSSVANVRIFGGLVVFSLILSSLFFDYAFISVWCFFAAILSLFILRMIRLDARRIYAALILPQPIISEANRP
jgi:hypothetical protein